jgi:porphobilinogen deaminase
VSTTPNSVLLAAIDHAETATALVAERAFLTALDVSPHADRGLRDACRRSSPVPRPDAKPDGSAAFETTREGLAGALAPLAPMPA